MELLRELQSSKLRYESLKQKDSLLMKLLLDEREDEVKREAKSLCLLTLCLMLRSPEATQTSLQFYRSFLNFHREDESVQTRCSFSEVAEMRSSWWAVLHPAPAGEEADQCAQMIALLTLSLPSAPPTLLLLLLISPPPSARRLVQAVWSSPDAPSLLLVLVQACPFLVEFIVSEMHHAVSLSGVAGGAGRVGTQEAYFACLLSGLCRDFVESADSHYPCCLPHDQDQHQHHGTATTTSSAAECNISKSQSESETSTVSSWCVLHVPRAVREKLSGLRFAPQLCLEITRMYLLDEDVFLASLIPAVAPWGSDASSALVGLNAHWLFSVLSVEQSRQISAGILEAAVGRIDASCSELNTASASLAGRESVSVSVSVSESSARGRGDESGWKDLAVCVQRQLRVFCVLVCVANNEHACSSPSAATPQADCVALPLKTLSALTTAVERLSCAAAVCLGEFKVPAADDSRSADVAAAHIAALQSLFKIRSLAFAAHWVCLYSICTFSARHRQQQQHAGCTGTSARPPAQGRLPHCPLVLGKVAEEQFVSVLDQMVPLLTPPFTSDLHAHLLVCRRAGAGGSGLWDKYTSFMYFSFHIKACMSFSLSRHGTAGLSALLQSVAMEVLSLEVPEEGVSSSLMSLSLQRFVPRSLAAALVLPYLDQRSTESHHKTVNIEAIATEFRSLPIPVVINAESQHPGDWMSSLRLLLRSPCAPLVLRSPPQKAQPVAARTLLLEVIAVATSPTHAHLHEVIDRWLNCSVCADVPPHQRGKPPIPMLPNEIKQLTAPLAQSTAATWAGLKARSSVSLEGEEGAMASVMQSVEQTMDEGAEHGVATGGCSDAEDDRIESQEKWEGEGADASSSAQKLVNQVSRELQHLSCLSAASAVSPTHTGALHHLSSTWHQAAIACYASLKYISLCRRSAHTNYTAVFACDPRDLPLRSALAVLSCHHSALRSRATSLLQSSPPAPPSPSSALPLPLPQPSSMLSSYVQLLDQLSPELLIPQRTGPVAVAAAVFIAQSPPGAPAPPPLSSSGVVSLSARSECAPTPCKTPDRDTILQQIRSRVLHSFSDGRLQTRLSLLILAGVPLETSSPCTVTHTHTTTDTMVGVVMTLLREVLESALSLFSRHDKGAYDSAKLKELTTACSSIRDARGLDVASDGVWRLWSGLYALLACPSVLELSTLQLLLELGEVHRPRYISSYTSLAQEPLVLFRLPLTLLRIPLAFRLVRFMFRSLSVASGGQVRESSSIERLKEGARQQTHAETYGAARSVRESEVERHGGGSRRGDGAGHCEEFLTLQAVIAVRILLELWVEVRALALCTATATASATASADGDVVADRKSRKCKGNVVVDSEGAIGSGICSIISVMLADSPALLRAILHCGVHHWVAFEQLCYCPGATEGVAKHCLEVLALSLTSELSSPLSPSCCFSGSSQVLEEWLWHVIFLLKVHRFSSCSHSASRWICQLAESLLSFFSKTAHYSWWSVQALVGQSSGSGSSYMQVLESCVHDLLAVLSNRFPTEAVKITTFLTTASLPENHLFATRRQREGLVALHEHMCRRYNPQEQLVACRRGGCRSLSALHQLRGGESKKRTRGDL